MQRLQPLTKKKPIRKMSAAMKRARARWRQERAKQKFPSAHTLSSRSIESSFRERKARGYAPPGWGRHL